MVFLTSTSFIQSHSKLQFFLMTSLNAWYCSICNSLLNYYGTTFGLIERDALVKKSIMRHSTALSLVSPPTASSSCIRLPDSKLIPFYWQWLANIFWLTFSSRKGKKPFLSTMSENRGESSEHYARAQNKQYSLPLDLSPFLSGPPERGSFRPLGVLSVVSVGR